MNVREDPDSVARPTGDIDEGAATVVPIGPDGAPLLEAVNYQPAWGPPHTAEHCPCERNCRHYHHVVSHFEHGNAAGSLPDDWEPREHHRACTAQPGVYLELSGDSPVLECNRWEPIPENELSELEWRRERYYMQHPKHRPGPIMPTDDLDLDDDEEGDDEEEDDDDLDLNEDNEDEKERPRERKDTAE